MPGEPNTDLKINWMIAYIALRYVHIFRRVHARVTYFPNNAQILLARSINTYIIQKNHERFRMSFGDSSYP